MPSALTENEIIDRHQQALGEAHRACQRLGKNADPTHLAPRGHDYGNLKRALDALEGSSRQMAHFRADARWLKLGVLYAKTRRGAQRAFVAQRWAWFGALMPLFVNGQRSMVDLKDMKTGRASSSPILPSRPSDWLVMPDHQVPMPPMRGHAALN